MYVSTVICNIISKFNSRVQKYNSIALKPLVFPIINYPIINKLCLKHKSIWVKNDICCILKNNNDEYHITGRS